MENMERISSRTKRRAGNSDSVLITGGAGFIGSHLADRLAKEGYRVVVVDNLSSGRKENVNPKAKFYRIDVRSPKLSEIMKKEKVETVFHLAAQPIVEKAYDSPLETIETNIMGTVNVLESCREREIKAVIVASSDKAYGKSKILPYKEDHFLRGSHPYSFSKTAADLLARTYFETYELPVAVSRFGNVFGPRDINFNRIIPGIFESIIKKKELPIRSDGKMVREYVFVDDVIEGYILLANNIDKLKGEAFNFGSKNIYNITDLIGKIEKVLGEKVNYKILNIAKNEIREQYLDWKKAKKVLGFRPKTSFEEGIKKTFGWYKDYLR